MATDKAEMKIYFGNGSSISRANIDGTGVEVVLENADIWKVDFDWITRRLFWCTRTDGQIYVMSLHNKKKRQLTETRLRNWDIAVDPTVG
jgi:Tol biopolymer transport system component